MSNGRASHSHTKWRSNTHIQLTETGASLEGGLGALTASPATSEAVRGSSSVGVATSGLAGTPGFAEGAEGGLSAGLPCTPFSGDATVAEISPLSESAVADNTVVEEHCSGIAGTGAEIRCHPARHAAPIRSIGTLLTRKRIAFAVLA